MAFAPPPPADGNEPAGLLPRHLSSPALLLALVGVDAMNRLRAVLTTRGLTPKQFEVLGVLHDRGPTGQQELGTAVNVAPSVLVTLLNPLEHDEFIVRVRDDHDRRRHLVTLTSTGRDHLNEASDSMHTAQARMFSMLDTPQLTQLSTLLSQIRDGLVSGPNADRSPESLEHATITASTPPKTTKTGSRARPAERLEPPQRVRRLTGVRPPPAA